MSISRLSIARARARDWQVFRARAESPNAAGGTSGLTVAQDLTSPLTTSRILVKAFQNGQLRDWRRATRKNPSYYI